jgi:hypothetical protein
MRKPVEILAKLDSIEKPASVTSAKGRFSWISGLFGRLGFEFDFKHEKPSRRS